jgi:hypothetical protein
MAEEELEGLKLDLQTLERVRLELAEYYCEDAGTFKLEDCFKVISCIKKIK